MNIIRYSLIVLAISANYFWADIMVPANASLRGSSFHNANGLKGIINKKAVYCYVPRDILGKSYYAVAIDSLSPSDSMLSVIRFNLAGKLDFSDNYCKLSPSYHASSLLQSKDYKIRNFSGFVKYKTKSIAISGNIYQHTDNYNSYVQFKLNYSQTAEVSFRIKDSDAHPNNYQVTILDSNQNLVLGDCLQTENYFNRLDITRTPDFCIIKLGNIRSVAGYVGQPILIDKNWFCIKYIDGKIVAENLPKIEQGTIEFMKNRTVDCWLINKKHIFYFLHNAKDSYNNFVIPTGTYYIKNLRIKNSDSEMMVFDQYSNCKAIAINKGNTTKLTQCEPLQLKLNAKYMVENAERFVDFDFNMSNHNGDTVLYLHDKTGKSYKRMLMIQDTHGKLLKSVEMPICTNSSFRWKVPNNVEGKLSAKMKIPNCSFSYQNFTTQFSVDKYTPLRSKIPVEISLYNLEEFEENKRIFAFDNFGRDTFFFAKPPSRGSFINFTLKQLTIYKTLQVNTGDKNGADILEHGILEVIYANVAPQYIKLKDGKAKLTLQNDNLISFKIICTDKQNNWLRICDITLNP